ncbi:hypothetical protein R6Q57_020409 [Mikania cordata]
MSLWLPSTPFLRLCAAQSTTAKSQFVGKSFVKFSVQNCSSVGSHKLVMKVKEMLEKDYYSLPTGKYGRDDEGLILWFLKDRRFSVDEAISKLTKAIKWRQEFGVTEITEESVRRVAATGKSYVHDSLDVNGRPVLIVVPSKHIPEMFEQIEDERLCVFLLEKAISSLPEGKEQILGIFDLRGFGLKNSDLKFLTFLVSYELADYLSLDSLVYYLDAYSYFKRMPLEYCSL